MVGQGQHHQFNLGQIDLSPEVRVAGIRLYHPPSLLLMRGKLKRIVVHPQYGMTVLLGHRIVGPGTDITHAKDDDPYIVSVGLLFLDLGGFKSAQAVLPAAIEFVRIAVQRRRQDKTDRNGQ